MITYNQICEKLGFDPINYTEYNGAVFATDDDNYSNPLEIFSIEEIEFLTEYAKQNKH